MKKVIITGVSEGLGYEVAKQLIAKWVIVVGISRSTPDLDIHHISCDLSSEDKLEELVEVLKSEHSDLDALINCAGILQVEEADKISYKNTQKLFGVNVLAPMMLISWLFNCIKNNGADIVNVSSTVWFKAYDSQCAYWASKWSLRWVTENFRLEFKGTKTRIIWFNPWGFKSRIFEKATWYQPDLSPFMEVSDIAKALIQTLELPKNMEVSEIIINRK